MKLFSMALKLNSLFAGKIFCRSSLLADDQIQSGFDSGLLGLEFLGLLWNKIQVIFSKLIYLICSFILNFIEIIQIAVSRVLGISVKLEDYVVIDSTNPVVKILTNETVLNVFKACCGIAIVLIILFTIVSIVKSEYAFAVEKSETNGKGRILGRTLRSLFTMGMFPLLLLLGVVLTNAILAGFNDILRGGENTSMAAQVFISSAYNANNFRNYADDDRRIPLVVNFEDPARNGTVNGYSKSELVKIYESFQDKGRTLFDSYADRNFGSFSDTIVYKNNRLYNNSNYTGFEKFACTREQYYVMADFLDYAVKNNIKYYVKNIKDADIDWKYVSDSVYDKATGSLSITYKDASNLSGGESYKVVYTPTSESISSPISDALRTISALLAFDQYSDNTFNILKRLEDSINIVEWETDKVFVKFTPAFANAVLSDSSNAAAYKKKLLENMEINDLLILFEQSRFANNNTLGETITEIAKNGYELPVKKVTKRVYQPSINDYTVTDEIYVATINGKNYQVELNKELKDANGSFILDSYKDPYYTIMETKFGLDQVGGSKGNYTVTKKLDDGKEKTIKVNDNDVISISVKGVLLGNYTTNDDSFKDILITVLSGTQEIVGDSGLVSYATYDDKIETVIKQAAWPNKLIRDLQVIYKDININNLIANGSWLEQLSEYVSGGTYDPNGSNIQTGLIHPLGLIMSEFFLGNVSSSEKILSFGSLEYSTKFDNDTVKALILSMLGEDRYFQTKEQLNYFVEIFNAYMAPVLDEIAYYENFELLSGNSQSVQLYTYKAYLASVLLSSSASNWFYDTATALLGSVYLKESIETTEGYLVPYSTGSISDYYKSLINKVYANAKKRLEEQYVKETDAAYPEYMKALKAYIYSDPDKYFNGRYDLILQSIKSDSEKGRIVDNAKQDIKNAYNGLYGGSSSIIDEFINYVKNAASANNSIFFDETAFRFELSSIFTNPSSGFRYQTNKFDNSFGDDSKDDFDFITNSYDILNLRKNASLYKSDLTTEEDGKTVYLEGSLRRLFQDLRNNVGSGVSLSTFDRYVNQICSKADKYFDSVDKYAQAKEEFYNVDNSKANIGKRDKILNDVENYFDQATSLLITSSGDLYDWLVSNNGGKLSSDEASLLIKKGVLGIGGSSPSDYANIAKWQQLTDLYNKLKNNYTTWKNSQSDEYFEDEDNKNFSDKINTYIESIGGYVRSQNELDRLNRYEIYFAIESEMSDEAVSSLDIVVNSKHYLVGQNFTKAKVIEYVLGYDLCKEFGYSPVFVNEGYEGIVKLTQLTNAEINEYVSKNIKHSTTETAGWWYDSGRKYSSTAYWYERNPEYVLKENFITKGGIFYKASNSFADVHDFAVALGDISARLYQMSNLSNLSTSAIDEIVVGTAENNNVDLAELILTKLLNGKYLPEIALEHLFANTEKKDSSETKTEDQTQTEQKDVVKIDTYEKALARIQGSTGKQNAQFLNNVLSYLLMTDNDKVKKGYVDYTSLTLKEIRIRCLQTLIGYESQTGETTEEGQKRYLALLALGCSDWSDTQSVGAVECNWSKERRENIKELKVNNYSQAVILRLAGLDNRPYEELIDAEYSIDFNLLGEDEKNGDIFIICIFDSETRSYVPFMMTNTANVKYDLLPKEDDSENAKSFAEKFGYRNPYTEYYMSNDKNDETVFFPIIARGLLDSDGTPTAIRKVDGRIEYYHDDVVIRDASDIGISEYFLSVDQIKVSYTAVSYISNMVTKLFTGKTIVEHLAASIPRFAAHTNFNFCYGVNTVVETKCENGFIAMSYNFGRGNNVDITYAYDILNINIIILCIGTICLLSALVKALFAAIKRVFDLALDFVIAPLAISTIALKADEKQKEGIAESKVGYEKWKDQTVADLTSVFAFAVGFNIFFILVPIINSMQLFSTTEAFSSLPLFRHFSLSFLNEIGRFIFVVGLAYMTKRAPELFAGILYLQNGFDNGEAVKAGIKNMTNDVKNVWSGKAIEDELKYTRNSLKQMVPGREIFETAVNGARKVTGKAAGIAAEAYCKANGVPPERAKAAAKLLEEAIAKSPKNEKEKKDEARANEQRQESNANNEARNQRNYSGSSDADGGEGSGSSGGTQSPQRNSRSSSSNRRSKPTKQPRNKK